MPIFFGIPHPMLKWFGIVLAVLLVVSGVGFWMMMPKPVPLEPYLALDTPAISIHQTQRVLQATSVGDPSQTAPKAIGMLYQHLHRIDGASMNNAGAPMARWPDAEGKPREQWTGQYALRIPDTAEFSTLEIDGVTLEAVNWSYGPTEEVGEILHRGSYDSEMAAVERLKKFVEGEGYLLSGAHEEIYLRGPGMFSKGNPKDYITLIRYPVSKKSVAAPESANEAEAVKPAE